MREVELVIIGAGPAGLCAAITASEAGVETLVVERDNQLGGQLIKQTHMFFGSEKQYASKRGLYITDILLDQIEESDIEIMKNATVLGIYENKVLTILQNDNYIKVKAKNIIVATGASEKVLAFPNNDLPGVYGAGAVQTLMNVYGVKPGEEVIMVGAGNIGLIVSYQMIQAGVKVKAVVDAAPTIGGYLVHASKLARLGVPILTRHSIKEAIGEEVLEGVIVWELDENWKGIEGTEREVKVDTACISVGLTPLVELLSMSGCDTKFVPTLGGNVPIINHEHETSIDGVFVAGDVSGVEEASSAMVEGYITGLNVANKIGKPHPDHKELLKDYHKQLNDLRSGPVGDMIRKGIEEIMVDEHVRD